MSSPATQTVAMSGGKPAPWPLLMPGLRVLGSGLCSGFDLVPLALRCVILFRRPMFPGPCTGCTSDLEHVPHLQTSGAGGPAKAHAVPLRQL